VDLNRQNSEDSMELMGFDVIGDIHGYAATLKKLLQTMGYRSTSGVFSHPTRKALFLGDYIDRGPYQEETITVVQSMVRGACACPYGES